MLSNTWKLHGSSILRLVVITMVLALPSCDTAPDRVPVYPVQGKLLVDGQPAEGAIIIFHPRSPADRKTTNPNGRVQQDGSFQLTTFESGDGAPAGEYAVTIFWPEPSQDPTAHPAMGADRLENRYINPESSEIHVTVKEEEENVLDPIQLER